MALFFSRFGHALRRALADALAREQELARVRDSLDQTVSERTADLRIALADIEAHAADLRAVLAENDQQRTLIRELSVPVLPVDPTTLVIPLVGPLDSARLRDLQEQALHAVQRLSAGRLLLDITGVPLVDSHVAQGLLAVLQATRLLGAETALVGIRPEVAQALVSLGVDLSAMRSYRDLQTAIGAAS
ncbi:MAG TPA: STAS domain-containing protein [Roseiflexaceae bacterium]